MQLAGSSKTVAIRGRVVKTKPVTINMKRVGSSIGQSRSRTPSKGSAGYDR